MSIASRLPIVIALSAFAALASAPSSAAQPATCNRACLEGFVERYLDAVT